jgi:hypothetical protein
MFNLQGVRNTLEGKPAAREAYEAFECACNGIPISEPERKTSVTSEVFFIVVRL